MRRVALTLNALSHPNGRPMHEVVVRSARDGSYLRVSNFFSEADAREFASWAKTTDELWSR